MKVTVYSQGDCKDCVKVKSLLSANDVEFEVKDINEDEEAKSTLLGKGFLSTPVTEVITEEGTYDVHGFNIGRLAELLDF